MAELRPSYMDGVDIAGFETRNGLLGLQEGVFGANDLRPTINGAQIDIATGRGVVQNDWTALDGLYGIANDATKNSAAFEGGGLPAAAAQPAVHQIVAKVWDPAFEAVGVNGRRWRLMVVPGVPTAGTTIDTRAGAVDLTAGTTWKSAMRIADVHVAANGTITLRDRRPWARGFTWVGQYATADQAFATNAYNDLTSSLEKRCEFSGAPVEVRVDGLWKHSVAGSFGGLVMAYDTSSLALQRESLQIFNTAGSEYQLSFGTQFIPSPGSHLLRPRARTGAATLTILANAAYALQMSIRERITQNADNS